MELDQETCKSCVILHCCNLMKNINNLDLDLNDILINLRALVSIGVVLVWFLLLK